MGFGNYKKAFSGAIASIPVVGNPAAKLLTPSGYNAFMREQRNLEEGSRALEENAIIKARAAKEQAIAAESVRLQEEEARKRTLFGGSAIGQTNERKSLLGL